MHKLPVTGPPVIRMGAAWTGLRVWVLVMGIYVDTNPR